MCVETANTELGGKNAELQQDCESLAWQLRAALQGEVVEEEEAETSLALLETRIEVSRTEEKLRSE